VRLVITSTRRFIQSPDGNIWTPSSDDYRFWQRYLAVFDSVVIIARVYPLEKMDINWKLVTGSGVSVAAIPQYNGFIEYLLAYIPIMQAVRQIIRPTDAVILRIPSHVSSAVEPILRLRQQPYGAEIIGDTAATLSAESLEHPLRPFLRFISVRAVRRMCRNASSLAYVTETALQAKYPPSAQAFSTHYSSIELPDELIAKQAKIIQTKPIRIISVGSMAMKYKRFDILIEAVKRNIAAGLDIELILVGDGRHRAFFETCAKDLENRVKFIGELGGSEYVREELLAADLFVLASANEGLPRVIIEAMAVGMPCIGTTVGGTSELLPSEDLVAAGDIEALTSKLREVIANPSRLQSMARRNLDVVRRYTSSQLSQRRQTMYQHLREISETWQKKR
jgi:glycosyltransferase involved in cell wall biosynthesis